MGHRRLQDSYHPSSAKEMTDAHKSCIPSALFPVRAALYRLVDAVGQPADARLQQATRQLIETYHFTLPELQRAQYPGIDRQH